MSAPVQVGPSPTGGGPAPHLTDNELLILRRSAAGDTYDSIGIELHITPRAVGKAASRMFVKLGAKSMPHAVHLAHGNGLLSSGREVDMPLALVQVLELVAAGCTNAEIAQRLIRPENTVIDQVKAARKRLGARDRAHAAALAVDLRIVRVDTNPAPPAALVDAA